MPNLQGTFSHNNNNNHYAPSNMASETPSVPDSPQPFHGNGFDQTHDTVTSTPVHEYHHNSPDGFDNLARDFPAMSDSPQPVPWDDSNQVAEESIRYPTQARELNYGVAHQQPVPDERIRRAPENQWRPVPQFTGDSEIPDYIHKIIDIFWGSNATPSQQSIDSNSRAQPEGSKKKQPPGEGVVPTPSPGSTPNPGDPALGPDNGSGLNSTVAGLMEPVKVWEMLQAGVATDAMDGRFFPKDQKHAIYGDRIHCKVKIKITTTTPNPEWVTSDCVATGLEGSFSQCPLL